MSIELINPSPVFSCASAAKREGELAEGERPHLVDAGRDEAEPDGPLPASLQGSSSESRTNTDPRQVLGLRLPAVLSDF